MFTWKENYSCNIVEIDNQHKKLFEIGNKLYTIVRQGKNIDNFDKIMDTLMELKNYTIYHFDYEEALMEKYKYPELDRQKTEHKNFVRKINEIKIDDVEDMQDKVSMELLMFIANWIESHILKSDIKYREHFNNVGIY